MDFTKFKSLLDDQMSWPDYYVFKFVTKTEDKSQLLELLTEHKISEKMSKTGKYTSVSSRKICHSSEDVIEVYQSVSKVEGVITL